MATFNLPFGIKISNNNVLDASRYVVDDIASRDFIISDGRAYNGLQTYVNDISTLYILKDVSNSIWGIIPDLSTIAISDASKLNNYTDTFSGLLTIDGSLHVIGNITQDGSYYVTNVEEITSKNEFITLREGAITSLSDGSISGLRIIKADGSTNVILGSGNDAVMRVGWEGDNLLAIATREDNPTLYGYAYWDDASAMFKTDVLSETVSRTIYLDASLGSDETGDGSISLPYATFTKVLSTIKKVINSGVTITIHAVAGTYDLTADDLTTISLFQGAGTLTIEGELGLVDSGFTMGAAEVDDPLTYAVSGGNTASWTANQWKYYFLKSGTSYYPLTHNTTATLSLVVNKTGSEIYENQTIITFTNSYALNFDIQVGTVQFKYIKLNIPNYTITFKGRSTFIDFHTCNIIGTGASSKFTFYAGVFFRIFSSSSSTIIYSFQGIYNGALMYDYFYADVNNYIINIVSDINSSGWSVFENPNTGSSSVCIYSNKMLTGAATTSNYYKFVNSYKAFNYSRYSNIDLSKSTSNVILLNTSYLISKRAGVGDYEFPINIYIINVIGTPNIRWFYDSMYEFVNLTSGRNIQIPGIIYPEFEQNLSSNLVNNSSNNIIIGDVSQNMSISLDYTVKRSTSLRKGKIDFMHDGSILYQSPDSFICSTSILDASALYFNSDVSGNLILLNSVMDSGSDASLFYNVSRVMRTPLII